MPTTAILGTVGVPANYGGFETLVENLVRYHRDHQLPGEMVVYCSAGRYPKHLDSYCGAKLRFVPLDANGAASSLYDVVSLFSAVIRGADVILLLGTSGAIALPILRQISRSRIIINMDGIEWRRKKWGWLARSFLHISEKLAVRFSDEVIADNPGIAQYLQDTYARDSLIITYGGDHAISTEPKPWRGPVLPKRYALALCRIEPENNVKMILEAFSQQDESSLVFVGNWDHSAFSRSLHQQYSQFTHLHLVKPVYDIGVLRTLRSGADVYVHGHSAGGTNPALVEAMHFGTPVLAFDCNFNRNTTENKAIYFQNTEELLNLLNSLKPERALELGSALQKLAAERYTWDKIGKAYFELLLQRTVG